MNKLHVMLSSLFLLCLTSVVNATSYVDFTATALTTAATNLTDTGTAAAAWALPIMVGIAAILIGFTLAKKFMRKVA